MSCDLCNKRPKEGLAIMHYYFNNINFCQRCAVMKKIPNGSCYQCGKKPKKKGEGVNVIEDNILNTYFTCENCTSKVKQRMKEDGKLLPDPGAKPDIKKLTEEVTKKMLNPCSVCGTLAKKEIKMQVHLDAPEKIYCNIECAKKDRDIYKKNETK